MPRRAATLPSANRPCAAPAWRGDVVLAGDDEIDGLGTLALFVGFNVESDALPLTQRLQPRAFNGGNVHEHVAAAVVGLDEAVAALAVEELDRTGHCHRKPPSP